MLREFWDGFINAPRYIREYVWWKLGYCIHQDVPRGAYCAGCGGPA